TAHTFTSTSPVGSAMARMTSSVTSVGTFAAFFGHDTHRTASARIRVRRCGTISASADDAVANTCTTSTAVDNRGANVTSSGSGASKVRYADGAPMAWIAMPGLMPSFWQSGVAE